MRKNIYMYVKVANDANFPFHTTLHFNPLQFNISVGNLKKITTFYSYSCYFTKIFIQNIFSNYIEYSYILYHAHV